MSSAGVRVALFPLLFEILTSEGVVGFDSMRP